MEYWKIGGMKSQQYNV